MKPVFGKVAVRAPNDASSIGTRGERVRYTVQPIISRAPTRYRPPTTGSSTCATGSAEPKRNSRQGSAKNSTKPFKPGIADSGSTSARAAR
jgi:hypothetical protein